MTRAYKEHKIMITHKELIAITCDWCGCIMNKPRAYEYREFTLEFSEGYNYYPDGGLMADGWKVSDLCNDCVVKLKALLEQNGIRTNIAEKDY